MKKLEHLKSLMGGRRRRRRHRKMPGRVGMKGIENLMGGRRMRHGRRGGFWGSVLAGVLPTILGPIANKLFGSSGEGRRRSVMPKIPIRAHRRRVGVRRRHRGGAVITPGPLA